MNEICADCGAPVRSHRVTGGGQPGTTYACGRDKGGPPTVPCLERQVVALKTIVDRLPKTADGVSITHDTPLFCPEGHELFGDRDIDWNQSQAYCDKAGCFHNYDQAFGSPDPAQYDLDECYSTRAAAEADKT